MTSSFLFSRDIPRGVTAIIGSGGKTTLLHTVGRALSRAGRVALCASAKMYAYTDIPVLVSPTQSEIARAFANAPLLQIGDSVQGDKLTLSATPLAWLIDAADYVLVEADGSAGLPLKAHAAHEPPLPQEMALCIQVVGIDGIGKPVKTAAHRPERYAQLLQTDIDHIVTPADAARVIMLEGYADMVFINKVETGEQAHMARLLAAQLNIPVAVGAFKKGETVCWL